MQKTLEKQKKNAKKEVYKFHLWIKFLASGIFFS